MVRGRNIPEVQVTGKPNAQTRYVSGRAKGLSTTSMGTAMLANGREISQKGKEYTTTQMATGRTFYLLNLSSSSINVNSFTGMRVFLTLESSTAKASSSMAPWTNMKETSSTAG